VFGEINDLESMAALVDDATAAILVETIQGESGINPCAPEFLRGLRKLCDERNLLLMVDEVQCGIGRTGKFYAFEHAGIRPDVVAHGEGTRRRVSHRRGLGGAKRRPSSFSRAIMERRSAARRWRARRRSRCWM
jgi:hypothetical protein